jgi:lysophospholipase L1-like esterase
VRRAAAYTRDIAFRVERRITKRYSDVELRQLRALQRVYADSDAPEVLIFGDSNMFWTVPGEADRRHMAQIIRDELGGNTRVHAVVGGGYNARIVIPFLSAVAKCKYQPKVVIVPTSTVMATNTWLAHPILGYEQVAANLQKVIDSGKTKVRRLERPLDYGGKNMHSAMPADPAWDAYDRLPVPSLMGIKRTVGEARLMVNSMPQTRWQKIVRFRHMLDYHQAERLEADTPGVLLVAQMGQLIRDMGAASVAYVSPINYELAAKLLGPGLPDHIAHNVEVVRAAYQDAVGDTGAVVNAAFQAGADGFSDVAHVKADGRRQLAASIAEAAKPLLAGSVPNRV